MDAMIDMKCNNKSDSQKDEIRTNESSSLR